MGSVRAASSNVGVAHMEARAQLERIVGSDAFARAHRLQRFLIYVVEEALAGQSARLKEYTLGLEVFDRGAEFDPRADPIVRVDARRLRRRLESYYAEEGAGDPVEISLARGGYAPIFRRRTAAAVRPTAARLEPRRLAVLPFRSLGCPPSQAAFAEGLVDELMLALGRCRELRVIGQASAARFKGGRRDLPEIGRLLNASLILEGEVRRSAGDRMRVVVTLSSAADGAQIWSESCDAPTAEAEQVFALQDRIAQQIVERLRLRVDEAAPARRRPTRDGAAYELYLRARHCLRTLNPAKLADATALLDEALERDPEFAHALAGLADAHFARAIYLMAPPVAELTRARELARAAVAVDPELSAANVRLPVLSAVLDHDFRAAADGFARALSLAPRAAAEARRERACWVLAPLGRLEEAATELRLLLENDPYALLLRLDYARILLFQRRYAEAVGQLDMLLDMEPRFAAATYYLAYAHEHSGDLARARAAHEQRVRDYPHALTDRWFEAACAVWDDEPARAQAIAREMAAQEPKGPGAAAAISDVYARLGDRGRALDWLERAVDERNYRVVYLNVDPHFDELRAEPRFQRLVRRVGLDYRRRGAPSQPLRRNQSSRPAAVSAMSPRAKG